MSCAGPPLFDQTLMTSSPASVGTSASWVTIGTSTASAVAAIAESFNGIRKPASRKASRSLAQASPSPPHVDHGSAHEPQRTTMTDLPWARPAARSAMAAGTSSSW